MNRDRILSLLEAVRIGGVTPEEAAERLSFCPFEDLGYAKVDHHRELRQGVPEVIYGQGKTDAQIEGILKSLLARGGENILVTRISPETAQALRNAGVDIAYHPVCRLGVAAARERVPAPGFIAVATGGTGDMPVAEEAAVTAEALGNRVERLYDVGVAGLHRLLAQRETLAKARVAVAVAGMEGALASVIGGLVACPVIAVPTSVGYGANFGGLSALLAMLNSCASGVSVVNIDNGFGAGYLASLINRVGGTT